MSSRTGSMDHVHPHIRGVAVDGGGHFIDVLTKRRLDDPLRLDDERVQNKIVLVNFFTIRSENETRKMAKVAELAKRLGDKMGHDFFINSVTSDPEHDTPERLATFAEDLGIPVGGWTFVRATDEAYQHMGSRMNRVRGYNSGREVFYGTPGGFWGTFPVDNSPEATAQRLLDSLPGAKPATLRRAGPARRGQERYAWSARDV